MLPSPRRSLFVVAVLALTSCGGRKEPAAAAPRPDAAPVPPVIPAGELPAWCAQVIPPAKIVKLTSTHGWTFRPSTRPPEAGTVDCQYFLGDPPKAQELFVAADCRPYPPKIESAKASLEKVHEVREVAGIGDAALAYSDAKAKTNVLIFFTSAPRCAITVATSRYPTDITGGLAREVLAGLTPDRKP